MTITATRYLEPILTFTPAQGAVATKSPGRIWHATDPPFNGYQPPPSDAFEQTSNETAIVIDNGECKTSSKLAKIRPLIDPQGPVFFEPVGPSIQSLESHSQPTWPATEIASSTEHAHMSDMMPTPMLPLGGRYATLSSLGAV